MNIKSCQIVYASSVEEFFYKDCAGSDIPVSEGQPVGVDLEIGDEVVFVLLDEIYWSDEKEKISI